VPGIAGTLLLSHGLRENTGEGAGAARPEMAGSEQKV
jgi:hypothetical protein